MKRFLLILSIPLMIGVPASQALADFPPLKDGLTRLPLCHFELSSISGNGGSVPAEVDSGHPTTTCSWGQGDAEERAGQPSRSEVEKTSFQHPHSFAPLKQARNAASFLNHHGITFSGWLQFDGSSVASGGLPNAIGFDGQYLLDVATTIDTKQLVGWPGGTFLVDVQTHSGPNILTQQMPALQDPDNMDAGSFTSVDRAWYQQDLLRQKVQLQVGLIYVDDKFLSVPYGQNFLSLDFSSDSSISTFVLPTFPKGSFGGDVFVYPGKGLYFSFGMFNDHSTELPYDPGGDLYITEEAWQGSWHGLPFGFQAGAWRDTGRFQRFLGGVVHHASGEYVVLSQKLWQPAVRSSRGIGTFFQFGQGPPTVAPVHRHYGAGVVWTGPFASRPRDEIGFAFSDSILSTQAGFMHGFENEFEGYYQISVFRGLTVQPDIEYWQHPNGDNTPNTVLALTRIMYTF